MLSTALEQSTRGDGNGVLILGEAGIGKSHLLRVLQAEAKGVGCRILSGRCFADLQQRDFAPFREAFSAVGSWEPSDSIALGSTDERLRLFDGVIERLGGIATSAPVLLAVEDLQWADADSVRLFRHIARFGMHLPLLLVGTVRSPDPGITENPELDSVLAAFAREPNLGSLRLRPFAFEEVASFGRELLGGELPQALVRALHVETGGNALYLKELGRHLLEEGKVSVQQGRVASDIAIAELGLPPSLRHVVMQRLARVSATTRSLLFAAAVADEPVSWPVLVQVCGSDKHSSERALDQGLALGVLRANGANYDISHAVVQRAIYEEISPPERSRLHRKLAQALSASLEPDWARVAAHFHASRELPERELGVRAAMLAASAARGTGAHERAATFFELAIGMAESAPSLPDLYRELALAYAAALDPERAQVALDAGLMRLPAEQQREQTAVWSVVVLRLLVESGCPRASWQPLVARAKQATLGCRDLAWAQVQVLATGVEPLQQGPLWISYFAGFDAEALRLLREQGDEADFAASVEPHAVRQRDETLSLLARVESWTQVAPRLRVLDACLRDHFFRYDDLRAAVLLADRQLALAESAGSVTGQVTSLIVRGCCHAALGAFDAARADQARALAASARLGSMHRMNTIGPLALETTIGVFIGAEWRAIAERLLSFLESPSAANVPFGIVPLSLAVVGFALAGEAERVDSLLQLHVAALEALPHQLNEWAAGRDCGVSALWLTGHTALAERYLALCDASPNPDAGACWSSLEHSQGRLLALLGKPQEALERFAHARRRYQRSGREPALAFCDFDSARVQAEQRREGAHDALIAARNAFVRLGMTPWRERTEGVLAEFAQASTSDVPVGVSTVGAPPQQGPAAAAPASTAPPDGLTPRELEVLVLLARGLANKEIARELFISVSTVERHLANAYSKIKSKGRAAATAYVLRNGLARAG